MEIYVLSNHDDRDITILGAFTSIEMANEILDGKIVRNRKFKGEFVGNDEVLIGTGIYNFSKFTKTSGIYDFFHLTKITLDKKEI